MLIMMFIQRDNRISVGESFVRWATLIIAKSVFDGASFADRQLLGFKK